MVTAAVFSIEAERDQRDTLLTTFSELLDSVARDVPFSPTDCIYLSLSTS